MERADVRLMAHNFPTVSLPQRLTQPEGPGTPYEEGITEVRLTIIPRLRIYSTRTTRVPAAMSCQARSSLSFRTHQ
jgi:hypothetical protein